MNICEVHVSPNRSLKVSLKLKKHVSEDSAAAAILKQTASAVLTTKDAADNLVEFLEVHDRMAFITIRDCEQELDRLERVFDDEIPVAMTQVGEQTARELVACLRYITDLERIADLVWWVAKRKDETRVRIGDQDLNDLRKMIAVISAMLEEVHSAFRAEDTDAARRIILRDRELDEIRHRIYSKHLKSNKRSDGVSSLEVVFMAQALERVGDHITNLAEELIHLADGQSVRHSRKKSSAD